MIGSPARDGDVTTSGDVPDAVAWRNIAAGHLNRTRKRSRRDRRGNVRHQSSDHRTAPCLRVTAVSAHAGRRTSAIMLPTAFRR
jgi:hypothetical protein